VLAILAMLALKGALRVAPGGSAPLFPSAPPHAHGIPGRDGKAGASAELESRAGVINASPQSLKGDILAERKQGTFWRCVDTTLKANWRI
jgi:hypothetical protein